MQTFLPYASYVRTARVLDAKRLGKQRVEAWQILQVLAGEKRGWSNHPATRMWRGHERALAEYGLAICDEWVRRGYRDSMRERFVALVAELPDTGLPTWLGRRAFHRSHQSHLLRKDAAHYAPLFVDASPDIELVWPV